MATLTLKENELYFFDEEAADRPCRFIRKYLKHWEGKFADEPFILLPWQREIIRNLFGWKRRSDNLRKHQTLYLLSGKGAGKTPLLTGIGLYTFLMDGEAAPHVISMASSFGQADLTFDAAKKYILGDSRLAHFAKPQQYKIVAPGSNGKWTIASGKPTGRSGSRPSCIIASELHEWSGATGESFNLLTANLFKRTQPLLLLDTNAGKSRQSFAWQIHERALDVLNGSRVDDTLLPVIYEAPANLEWTSEAAAKAANPSLGEIFKFDRLQPKLTAARQDESAEAEYRRLYLSQWAQDKATKWLDLELWDKACADTREIPKGAALYVGGDFSLGDDLCAVLYVWVTPERFWVQSHFFVPRSTAEKYELKEGIPYKKWAAEGAITLLDENTISPAVRRRIASFILETNKVNKVKAFCYDRYRADETVAALEGAGVVCIPIAQGYSVTPGCAELERRLKEGSIVIDANPVLRAAAENVEVKSDDRGNYWPCKQNAKGKYAGKRSSKIDGISALVTAMVEARRHSFPAVKRQWVGSATII